MNDCNKDKQLEGELCNRPSTDLLPDYYDVVKSRVDLINGRRQVIRNIFDNVENIEVLNTISRFISRNHDEH